MEVESGGQTDVGRVRALNEDYWLQDADIGLYVVCDGMGGHACGDEASRLAAETIHSYLKHPERRALIQADPSGDSTIQAVTGLVRSSVEEACRVVHNRGLTEADHRGMGTTCTMMQMLDGKAVMAHVGDSRLYMVREGELHQLSDDHSFLAEAVRFGLITEEQAAKSEHSNVITRAVGPHATVLVDTLVFDVLPGDTFLLCSDGLHHYFSDEEELVGILSQDDTQEIADRLVSLSVERGGEDNITALIVRAPDEDSEQPRVSQVHADFAALRHIELFNELTMPELVRVCAAMKTRYVEPTQVVVAQGATTESLYVIVEGQLAVELGSEQVAELSSGDHFGEMALLTERPRSASVRTLTGCRLLELDRDNFYSLVQQDPIIGIKFLWKLAQTLSLRLDNVLHTTPLAHVDTLGAGLYPSPFEPRRSEPGPAKD